MLKPYRTIQDVLASPWAQPKMRQYSPEQTDRVLRSTKLEDSIYRDLRAEDTDLDVIEQTAGEKLKSFSALSQDVFQSFYSLMPRRNDEENLTTAARKFNAPILEHITQSEDYPTLKTVCEGRELPAYEAAAEFISKVSDELDDLLPEPGGKSGALNTLEKLEQAEEKAANQLEHLLEQFRRSEQDDHTLNHAIVKAANEAQSKHRQVEAVGKLIDADRMQSSAAMERIITQAVSAASEKASEIQAIIGAWSDDPADLKRTAVNTELLERVRRSETLREVSKYLGRFREIFAQGRRNGFSYGRGEKYSLELGNNLSRALTSELAMLSAPETLPLFLRKYQRKQIKQYCRRESIRKGRGDIICCVDESGSMSGEPTAWSKAVALTLLEVAESEGRKFALIHFSGPGSFQTDLFLPKQYGTEDKLRAAETFLDGGTDFHTPLEETLRLMREDGFENADIVFITDGKCALTDEYITNLQTEQAARRFTITGILLDEECAGMDFSLKAFCQNIYRTSELAVDCVVQKIVRDRM